MALFKQEQKSLVFQDRKGPLCPVCGRQHLQGRRNGSRSPGLWIPTVRPCWSLGLGVRGHEVGFLLPHSHGTHHRSCQEISKPSSDVCPNARCSSEIYGVSGCFLSRSGVTSAASFCVCEHDAEDEVEKLRPNKPEFCLHSSF